MGRMDEGELKAQGLCSIINVIQVPGTQRGQDFTGEKSCPLWDSVITAYGLSAGTAHGVHRIGSFAKPKAHDTDADRSRARLSHPLP